MVAEPGIATHEFRDQEPHRDAEYLGLSRVILFPSFLPADGIKYGAVAKLLVNHDSPINNDGMLV